MTYVDRVTESQMDASIREIEQEFNITLDDLGIEVQYVSHPEDVDEELASIRNVVIMHLSDEQLAEIAYWQPTAYHAADRNRAVLEMRRRSERKKDTPAQILARWEQGFRRDAVTGAWVK